MSSFSKNSTTQLNWTVPVLAFCLPIATTIIFILLVLVDEELASYFVSLFGILYFLHLPFVFRFSVYSAVVSVDREAESVANKWLWIIVDAIIFEGLISGFCCGVLWLIAGAALP